MALCEVPTDCGYVVGEEISQHWDGRVIALTLVISLCGAFTSLTISGHLQYTRSRSWYWIFVITAGLGVGVNTVWAMHFVGMGALKLKGGTVSNATAEIPIMFEVLFSIISGAAAWAIASLGLHIMANRDASQRKNVDRQMFARLGAASLLIAVGVVVMHYMGMISQTGPFRTEYDPLIIFVSGLIAQTAAGVGLMLLMLLPGQMRSRFAAACLISVAVNGMHYTGMQSATYTVAPGIVQFIPTTTISLDGRIVGTFALMLDLVLYSICDSYGTQMKADMDAYKQREAGRREQAWQRTLQAAVLSVGELNHPVACVPAVDFMALSVGSLSGMHEQFRKNGNLRIFDCMQDIIDAKANEGLFIIFFSYQCLQWAQAGPNVDQLEAMKAALQELALLNNKSLDQMSVWLDCLSIPQRNKAMQAAAINGIYTVASMPNAMVIVCPPSKHADTGEIADRNSIRDRLWCRVEHLSYFCSNGASSMYLHEGKQLARLPDDWMVSVCCVFDASSTCCRLKHSTSTVCDRQVIVQPLLALYFDVFSQRRYGNQTEDTAAWRLIQQYRERMFPRTFIYADEEGDHERELFGNMLPRVEEFVMESSLCTRWMTAASSGGRMVRARTLGVMGHESTIDSV